MRGAALTFDPTISLGNILSTAAIVISLVITYGRLAYRLGAIETKVEAMWKRFVGIST